MQVTETELLPVMGIQVLDLFFVIRITHPSGTLAVWSAVAFHPLTEETDVILDIMLPSVMYPNSPLGSIENWTMKTLFNKSSENISVQGSSV